MKIGEQNIDYTKLERGINKDVGLALARLNSSEITLTDSRARIVVVPTATTRPACVIAFAAPGKCKLALDAFGVW